MTRGIRNNNPLNIRHGRSQWVGMAEVQKDRLFVQFSERVYGYRAAFVLIRNYIRRYAANSIAKIISRWAPSSDGNNTQAYIDYVSRSTGIPAGEVLRYEDKDRMVEIVRSMAQMESGIVERREMVEAGYEMAGG